MLNPDKPVASFAGRTISQRELDEIKETISLFGNLSCKELTHTICEHLDWRTPTGTNKWDACFKMLRQFEKKGLWKLPEKQSQSTPCPVKIHFTARTAPLPPLTGSLKEIGAITLDPPTNTDETGLWNEYTDRYHYLGYKKPFGYAMKYFIRSRSHLLGCILFSGPAKAITIRDDWIGWSAKQRLNRLPWVTNNSRFLIFPWVHVKNLASHILGKAEQQLPKDWQARWGFSPVLMETFVDPEYYPGTSYRAANWTCLGLTSGKGLTRKNKTYTTTPKQMFVRPLTRTFRSALCKTGSREDRPP